MIIVRTPYRISFFGGGTDYPSWYRQHGGQVLSTTIDKYCYICLRSMPAFLGSKYRVFWSHMETVDRIEDIQHPGVRGCLQYLQIDEGVEVNHAGDLPARSGLGSSSAFTVGMLHALHVLREQECSKASLAWQAVEVEQRVLQETVGIQDQIECAHGGLNHIRIEQHGDYHIEPVEPGPELEKHFVLVFTGIQRHASEIASDQVTNIERKQDSLMRIAELVPQAVDALQKDDLEGFGQLLHESWQLKRGLSGKIANPEIDDLYEYGLRHGAWGGKILGAGGGGFMLFMIPPEYQANFIGSLPGKICQAVRFEENGTQLILK